ncbi:hypothetical protein AMELA_G00117210 [Ameiurus melas]|uniref:Reverse transcriptase/retrotransposon-derived protein RNase H-like domain-containing protein n=1 Tax=Ameiurus melas TaxID=219545 RepID=A0A7J6AUZ4_AMEME|nr:hypothetical protein AMELA_G00117210 [Ameiurus melas]
MPTEPEMEAARPIQKPWLAGCSLHLRQPPEGPTQTVWVEGRPVTALLDTGSTVILARPSVLPSGLRPEGVLAIIKKCHLGLTEAQYLGYHIGRGLLKPQEKKIKAVKDYPRPTSKKQVRAFLGLAGYYRRFVPNFSAIASPLSDLTKKGQQDWVKLSTEAERAFQALKRALTSVPVLQNPDFMLLFIVHTDASETGLGAVLSQTSEEEELPVLYISQKLSPAKKRTSRFRSNTGRGPYTGMQMGSHGETCSGPATQQQ